MISKLYYRTEMPPVAAMFIPTGDDVIKWVIVPWTP